MDNQLIDYTDQGFTIPIIKDEVKGYASVHAVHYRESDGLDFAGSYFVYLLHPIKGSANFIIEPSGDLWEKIDSSASWIDEEILTPITEEIEIRRIKGQLRL
jgi:hypothetical protein